jgi:dihydroorotase
MSGFAMGETIRLRPFVDGHVHLREPGSNPSETIESGTMAAILGGVGMVADMSNNAPMPTATVGAMETKHAIIRDSAYCYVGTAAGAQPEYDNLGELERMLPRSVFVKLYGGETTNIARTTDYEASDFREALAVIQRTEPDKLVVFHPGQDNYRDFIGIAAGEMGLRVRLAHVSSMDQVRAVQDARARGLDVRAEVTPHHLLLNSNDRRTRSSFADMQPPLVDQVDSDALFDALVQGYIHEIGTDHAPHPKEKKLAAVVANPSCDPSLHGTRCCGVEGVDLAAPLLFWQVHTGRLSLERIQEAYSTVPADSMRLAFRADSWVDWRMEQYRIEDEDQQVFSSAKHSPYLGMMAIGTVDFMYLGGKRIISEASVNDSIQHVVHGSWEQM